MSQNILLPQGFLPIDTIQLCRFLVDLKDPQTEHHDPGIDIDPKDDTLVSQHLHFSGDQQNGSSYNLGAELPTLVSASIANKVNSSTKVNATRVTYYGLRNSGSHFKRAVRNAVTRLWIEEQYDNGWSDLFFVVGYYTMQDATVSLGEEQGRNVSGQAQVPVSAILAAGGIVLPAGGFTDPKVIAAYEKSKGSRIQFLATGERICAFQYRRVIFKWFSSRNIDKAKLETDNRWHTVSPMRDLKSPETEEEDDVLQVELEGDDEVGNGNMSFVDALSVPDIQVQEEDQSYGSVFKEIPSISTPLVSYFARLMAQNLNNPDGLVNLRNLAQEVQNIAPADPSVPIVFVPGFSGWGAPLFGAINYFGGEIDIPNLLVKNGYTVIVASIGPISSNWERACELYRQLTFGKFNTIKLGKKIIEEVHDVDIDYGNYFGSGQGPEQTHTKKRKRAILYSPPSSDFETWKWDRDHKVHFVCHSQGGNTVRYLLSLMTNGAETLHPEYFGQAGRDDWTISVTTLGTPHRGTTIINALESFLNQPLEEAYGLAARLFAAASFDHPSKRAYDLQLDHWGIRRKSSKRETFQDMLTRLESEDGPVWRWLNSQNNGFYDNSIEGVHGLSLKTMSTSEKVFYFSLSFHATNPFPEDWPDWGQGAFETFPFSIAAFVRRAVGGIPVLGRLTESIINAFLTVGWKLLPSITGFRPFVGWVTKALITRILHQIGYRVALPDPGAYIPRPDVIPIMLPTVYAMGGQQLTQAQRDLLGPDMEDWLQNDGIVNTVSMPGPKGSVRSVDSLPDVDFSSPGKRGVYWHLGVNDVMDHADEIGIFIERTTAHLLQHMYLDIASLITRLPAQ
ncbi:lipase [Trichoderma arundinaceum]|uniref:Lipase n=1 Tax=Trichoderma arundinaceum TaxID=490622 RepID=A0A395P1I7_TRIAR|nr:lipase [Trichoderma arundinaceum]